VSVLITRGLKKFFGAHEVLRGVDLAVEAGEKIGIVGRNGGGKSTLLRICAGLDSTETGEIIVPRNTRVGYVAQRPEFEPGQLALGYVEEGLSEVKELLAESSRLEHDLATLDGDALDRAVMRFGEVTERIDFLDGWNAERQAEVVLDGIGLSRDLWQREARTLSGGEKARVAMARELVRRPDLLMLDEPTNHLDLEGIEWLENYLLEFPGALLLISHDRRMLDRVVTNILELEWGQVRRFPGNYHKYVQLREERFASELRSYEIQRDRIKKEEQFIKKHMGSQRTAEAKGRQKKLEHVVRLKRPYNDVRTPVLRIGEVERSGEVVLKTENLTIGYGDNPLHEGLEVRISRGDRIALVGPNGAGKTTLMKVLAKRSMPLDGEVEYGHRSNVGYFDQETSDLDPNLTPFLQMRRDHPTATDEEIRSHLALFLFRGNDVDADIAKISGGERARLALARLVWLKPTWLALDEPTNHLDLAARAALEEMLSGYVGPMLCISHDRQFMDNLCTVVWELKHDGLRVFQGNYSAYRDAIVAERDGQQAAKAARVAQASKPAQVAQSNGGGKGNGGTNKQGQGGAQTPAPAKKEAATKVRNPFKFERLEKRIMELEKERERINAELLKEATYRDPGAARDLQYRLAELERDLEEKNRQWENWE
jgi:ATP-binding cassette, subfamily F, member 3